MIVLVQSCVTVCLVKELIVEWTGLGIITVFALILYFGYSADEHNTRVMRLRDGVTPRGALPLPVMTPEFAARFQSRLKTEKRSIAIALIFALCINAVMIFRFQNFGASLLMFIWVAFYCGRAVANIIDRTREISNNHEILPRYSRGRYTSLWDFFPKALFWLAILITVLLDVSLLIFGFQTVLDTLWKQVLAIMICILFPLIGWLLAAYIARQPVYANSEADLRWEDRLMGEDIQILSLFGEILPAFLLLVLFENVDQQNFTWILITLFLVALIVLGTIMWAGNSIAQRRLWPDPEFASRQARVKRSKADTSKVQNSDIASGLGERK